MLESQDMMAIQNEKQTEKGQFRGEIHQGEDKRCTAVMMIMMMMTTTAM